MTERKYREQYIKELFSELMHEDSLSYEELMQKYKGVIRIAQVRFKDDAVVLEQIQQLKKKCLIVTVRRLAEEEQIDLQYIQQHYPGLDRAARQLHNGAQTHNYWRKLVNETGVEYPCRERIDWTLGNVLATLSSMGETADDFRYAEIQSSNSGLMRAIEKKLGLTLGKALILTGIDYLKRKDAKNIGVYQFMNEELIRIGNDKSLNQWQRARVVFNALSLQYYPSGEYSSEVRRELDYRDDEFYTCQRNAFFGRKLETLLEQHSENLTLLRVSLYYYGHNPFHNCGFYFQGKKAIEDAADFHYWTNASLESIVKKSAGSL